MPDVEVVAYPAIKRLPKAAVAVSLHPTKSVALVASGPSGASPLLLTGRADSRLQTTARSGRLTSARAGRSVPSLVSRPRWAPSSSTSRRALILAQRPTTAGGPSGSLAAQRCVFLAVRGGPECSRRLTKRARSDLRRPNLAGPPAPARTDALPPAVRRRPSPLGHSRQRQVRGQRPRVRERRPLTRLVHRRWEGRRLSVSARFLSPPGHARRPDVAFTRADPGGRRPPQST